MSTTTKIALSIAGACLIGGLALFATAFGMVDGDLGRLSQPTGFEQRSYVADGSAVTTITLQDANTALRLVESSDDRVHLSYVESERDFYDIDLANTGALTITYRDTRRWFERLFDFSFVSSHTTVLAVPAGFLGDLSLRTSNGRISGSSVSLQGNLNLRTSNGRVQLDAVRLSGDLGIATSNGAVELSSVEATTVTARTTNGAVTAERVVAETELHLRASNGRIATTAITAGRRIELEASNGHIEGTIDDEMSLYAVRSRTSNGSNSLPENWGGGPKELQVSTSNGRIALRFLR